MSQAREHGDGANGRATRLSAKTVVSFSVSALVAFVGFIYAVSNHEARRDAAIDKQDALNSILFRDLERRIEDLQANKLSLSQNREQWNLFQARLPVELRAAVPDPPK